MKLAENPLHSAELNKPYNPSSPPDNGQKGAFIPLPVSIQYAIWAISPENGAGGTSLLCHWSLYPSACAA
jgi:hypothetical protein